MRRMIRFPVLLCLVTAVALPASATTFRQLAILNYTSPSVTDTSGVLSGYKAQLGYGNGLGVEFPLDGFGIEIDASYVTRTYTYNATILGITLNAQDTYSGIDLPLIFRWWPTSWVSIGAGGYLFAPIGSVTTNVLNGSTTASVGGISGTDYGVLGSLKFDVPLSGELGFNLEVQYQLGLATATSSSGVVTEKFPSTQVVMGLRFGGGSSRY